MNLEITIILIILVGLGSSILASLIGLGGGIVAIPLILLVIGQGNTLYAKLIAYVSIFVLSIISLIKYSLQKRKPEWKQMILIAGGVVPTTILSELYLGPLLQQYSNYFHIGFAILTLIVIVLINFKDKIKVKKFPSYVLPFFGMVIGVAAGSMGISGGVLFVPLLIIGLKMNLKEAAVNSIFLKIFASLANIVVGLSSGQYGEFEVHGIVWYLPLIISIGSIIGSQIGPLISKKINNKQMTITFNTVMSLILVWEITVTILLFNGIKI